MNNSIQKSLGLKTTQRGLIILSFGRLAVLGLIFMMLCSRAEVVKNTFVSSEVIVILFLSLGTLGQVYLLRNKNLDVSKLGVVQLAIDVLLITFSTRVIASSYVFVMYVIIIGCASLLLNSKSSIVLAAFSGICYGFVIAIRDNVQISEIDIFLAYGSLVLAALLGAFYANQIEGLRISITEKEKELERINLDRMHLIDSFSEGIITLDLNSAITGINQAAKILLGLSEIQDELVAGTSINETIDRSTVKCKDLVKKLNEGESTEVVSDSAIGETTLRCSMQSIKGEDGDDKGKVLFISDIGEFKNIEGRLETHEKMARLVGAFNINSYNNTSIPGIVGESSLLKELLLVVEQAAPSDAPVLILGESGTGKELIAKAVHRLSSRSGAPFIAVNCGAIPENLIESELFGHKKGSFTGADRDTSGLFREANGGTLFLDEIGELPHHMQAKLLRILQERLVRPVGASREVEVDVRIIAATNKNLKDLVKSNIFREDLYYRLRVIELIVPPLRMRKEDIPALIYYFLEHGGVDTSQLKISPEAWELLLNYNYPGNIRELENIIHRARVLGGGSILPEHFPEDVRIYKSSPSKELNFKIDTLKPMLPINLEENLERLEKQYLICALDHSKGLKKEAAKLLGLNFRSFRYRLKKYNLAQDEEENTSDILLG